MKTILGILLAVVMCGCGTARLPEQGLDYGPRPENYEASVRAFMEGVLKDPFTAQFKFGEPFQGYSREIPAKGGGIRNVGWVVPVAVNAKNSYGGYVGFKPYQVLIRDGKVLGLIARNPYFKEPWLHAAF